jgi:hypothetical protein
VLMKYWPVTDVTVYFSWLSSERIIFHFFLIIVKHNFNMTFNNNL